MNKKFITLLIATTMTSSIFSIPLTAKANQLTPSIELQENLVEKDFVKSWSVVDEDGIRHYLSMNYQTMIMTIDNEEMQFNVQEIALPKASLDYSSASTISSKIAWKGSVILLSSAIAGYIGGGKAAGWAATIAGALTADSENIYFSMTQYRSKERYWSNYHGTYYNKGINKNIIFRQASSNGKILCGPVNGGWFDPIRPY